jgi:hypothetical protein
VQLPQLYANYKAQSADGISMAFLIVWMLGDVTNLLGMIFPDTGVPWYCADFVLGEFHHTTSYALVPSV